MELRQLRHFIAVAEQENMRRASAHVHLSHPALSISIKKLEESLGTVLFDRSSKGVKLTEAGELLMDFAPAILKQVDDARATVKSAYSNPSGLVRLGCTPGVCNAIGVPIYNRARAQYPNIEVELDDSLTPILRRLFDIGLVDLLIDFDVEAQDSFRCDALIKEELFLVGPRDPNIAENEEIAFCDLPDFPIISSGDDTSISRSYEKYSKETGVVLQYEPGIGSAFVELALAEDGVGCVIVPWSLIYNRLGSTQLSARRIVSPVMYRTAYLLSALDRPLSRASLTMKDVIKSAVKEAHSLGHWRGELLCEVP